MAEPLSPLEVLAAIAAERHFDMTELVSGLPEGALAWRPAPEAASLAGLALHILDVTNGVLRVVAGELTSWSGPNGSRMDEVASEAELIDAIHEMDARLERVVTDFEVNAPGEPTSAARMLFEEMDHVALHHGQLQLTRHFWEAAHPEWRSEYVHWR